MIVFLGGPLDGHVAEDMDPTQEAGAYWTVDHYEVPAWEQDGYNTERLHELLAQYVPLQLKLYDMGVE